MATSNRRAAPRLARVVRSARLSPNLLRITFGGEAMADYPDGRASANLKLLLPNEGQDEASYLASLAGEGPRPVKRTYTVLDYRADVGELDIDFALHDGPGPATRWALTARPGQRIGITEPGGTKLVDPAAEWFLLAGDMSALPAIEANLRLLPGDATGHVVIEIIDDADRRTLTAPAGMVFRWLVDPRPGTGESALADAVRALPWQAGTPSVWIAGETGAVRELRRWLIEERRLESAQRYTSGYWQRGHDEDSHQQVKRAEPMD